MMSTARNATSGVPAPSRAVWILRVVAPLGAIALLVVIGLAFAEGAPLGAEGAAIAAFAWGVVTFVDLGLALLLGWAWIAWREASVSRAVLWLVATTVTGSVALLGYLAGAAWRANGVAEVLVGPHRRTRTPSGPTG
jgi:hypothetical protein